MILWRRLITTTIVRNTLKQEITRKCLHNYIHKNVNITSQALNLHPTIVTFNTVRYKTKKVGINDYINFLMNEEFDDNLNS